MSPALREELANGCIIGLICFGGAGVALIAMMLIAG